MRRIAVVLALLVVLPLPAFADDEEVAALEREVARLNAVIQTLEAEVAGLRARLAEMEARRAAERPPWPDPPVPVPTGPPPPLPEPVLRGAEPVADPVGIWLLDPDATRAQALEETLAPGQDPKERLQMVEMLLAMLQQATWTLAFNDQGRFTVVITRADGDAMRAAGTWTRDGNALTLSTTEEDGLPVAPRETLRGVLAGQDLRLTAPDMPFTVVFRRAPPPAPTGPVVPAPGERTQAETLALHAGRYVLDRDLLQTAIDAVIAEDPGQAAWLDDFRQADVWIVLADDGTFTAGGTIGAETESADGTWSVTDGRVQLLVRHRSGGAVTGEDALVGSIKKGVMHIQEDETPFPLVFRREP